MSWLGRLDVYIGMPHKFIQILHRHRNVHNDATDNKKSPKAKSAWFTPDFRFRDGACAPAWAALNNERVVVARIAVTVPLRRRDTDWSRSDGQ